MASFTTTTTSSCSKSSCPNLPTYLVDFGATVQEVRLIGKKIGIRLAPLKVAETTLIGGRIILVQSGSQAHKAGIVPGSVIVSCNNHPCNTGQTYSEILNIIKQASRPLELVLNVPKSPSQQLANLSPTTKKSFISIFAICLGNVSRANHWNNDNDSNIKNDDENKRSAYSHLFLQNICGMFGMDDEGFMSFVPLLEMGSYKDVSIKDAISSFLPQLLTHEHSMQINCQILFSSLTLYLLKEELYDSRARCVWRKMSECLGFNDFWFDDEEHNLALRIQKDINIMEEANASTSSLSSSSAAATQKALEETNKTSSWGKTKKAMKIGAAGVLGGALIFFTAGIAAPAVAGGVAAVGTGLGISAVTAGIVSFLGSAGGMAVLTSVLGTAGGGLTGYKMSRRLEDVNDFEFSSFDIHDNDWNDSNDDEEKKEEEEEEVNEAIEDGEEEKDKIEKKGENVPHMSTIICVNGWIQDDKIGKDSSTRQYFSAFHELFDNDEEEYSENDSNYKKKDNNKKCFSTLFSRNAQYFALDWERKELRSLGLAMSNLAAETALSLGATEVAKKTFLGGIMTALSWPATIAWAADYIDNSWSIACNRADKAGIVLAEVLESRIHGNNPVTLVGYSTGARVIFNCLIHMKTKGIIENVVLIGAPVTNSSSEWKKAKTMVSNRFVNAFSTKDWALRLLYRADQFAIGCAGLTPVSNCENFLQQFDIKKPHFGLRKSLGNILCTIDRGEVKKEHCVEEIKTSTTIAATSDTTSISSDEDKVKEK
jgi:hypothetical protein